jgi:hypothetical protein
MFLPVNDVSIGANSSVNFDDGWTLDGTLSASTGAGNTASVAGDGTLTIDGQVDVSVNSHLRLDTTANFANGAQATVFTGGTLELSDWNFMAAGSTLTLGHNGRLLQSGPGSAGWDGDVISNGGIIESTSVTNLRLDGSLTLGSVLNIRTRIAGSSSVRAFGPVTAPGLGAIIDGTFDVNASSNMSLGNSATIFVNGDLILRPDSTTTGNGFIEVNPGGELFLHSDANVGVDVVNEGDLHAGTSGNAGTAEINGVLTQTASGRLMVNLAGPAAMQRDMFQVWNDAFIGGTLHVMLGNGYVPAVGDQFEVLAANTVTGTFSAVTGAPGFSVSYTPDSVLLTYSGASVYGDVTGDGLVNVDDLIAVIIAWGPCPPAPAACPADITLDGQVNVDDLIAVIMSWG